MIQKQHQHKVFNEQVVDQFKGKSDFKIEDIREQIEALKKMKSGTYNELCMCFAGSREFLRYFGDMTKLKKGKK